jgi:hypothetical protein
MLGPPRTTLRPPCLAGCLVRADAARGGAAGGRGLVRRESASLAQHQLLTPLVCMMCASHRLLQVQPLQDGQAARRQGRQQQQQQQQQRHLFRTQAAAAAARGRRHSRCDSARRRLLLGS